jgi:Lrp/AsnC family transcriptional regulator, leucine-responsive regulatory protein
LKEQTALDAVDWRILAQLQEDARTSHAELARRVHLTPPAVAARVRRLEERGVVRGYRLELDLARLGLGTLAFVRVRGEARSQRPLLETAASMPEVLECHHVTGEDCYVVKVAARSLPDLERVVVELGRYGSTTTSIVFSTPIARRTLTQG